MMLRIAVVSIALAATPVQAQTSPQPKPSVEGYLCTFAGKCDGVDAPVETRAAPATRGFRLARPSSPKSDVPQSAAAPIRRPAARAVAAELRGSRGRAASYGASSPRVAAYRAPATEVGAPRRADLMIGFELNSDQLTSVGRESALIFARSLLTPELRDKRFLIAGHTDQRGGDIVNRPLSERRARRVADFLIEQGVQPSRLQTRGLGSSAPLPGHRATDPSNRRVEAELVS